jgi:hypothetical protein
MRTSLPEPLLAKIVKEQEVGREAWEAGDLSSAEEHFMNAWNALPEPKLNFDYAQIMSSGNTVFYRDTRQFDKAWQWIGIMRKAYGPEPNPYPEFLAGTVAYESGNLDEAFRLFRPLYEKYGGRPFQERDPKYLDLVRHPPREHS